MAVQEAARRATRAAELDGRAPRLRLVALWERDPTCSLCGLAVAIPEDGAPWLEGSEVGRYAVVHRWCGEAAADTVPLKPLRRVPPAQQ